jgi:2-dehydropantoate 2-reductase
MARRPRLPGAVRCGLRETVVVAVEEGVVLPPDSVERTQATMRSMPDHHMTSMGYDLLRGKPLELPWFAGKVVALGRRHSIPTPANGGFIHTTLSTHANGTPGLTPCRPEGGRAHLTVR